MDARVPPVTRFQAGWLRALRDDDPLAARALLG
jgi:hypothetical protein